MIRRWRFSWAWCIGVVLTLALPACDGVFPPPQPPAEPFVCLPPDARAMTSAGQILGSMVNAVADEWIIVFRSRSSARAMAVPRGLGTRALGGRFMHMKASKKDIEKLLKDWQSLGIEFITPNKTMSIPKPIATTQAAAVGSWGIDRSDQRDLPLDGKTVFAGTGAPVHAYVVDTGLHAGHPDLEGRVGEGYSAVGGGWQDDNGHGTHVSGTIASKTYGIGVKIIVHGVRVLINGSGTSADVIEGITWSTDHAAQNGWRGVGNMSLGGGQDDALDTAVCDSTRAGFLWAVAAGNESENACLHSPARASDAITVGATSDNDDRAYFSNTGKCVDIFAPGENITSLNRTNGTEVLSGTSMATPHVTGAAAVYLALHLTETPAQVTAGLLAMATPDTLTDVGTDSPNLMMYIGAGDGPGPGPGPGPIYKDRILHQCGPTDTRWCLPDGSVFDHAGCIACCLGCESCTWDGWPLVTAEYVNWCRQQGNSTIWHRRPGPFISSDEYWNMAVRPTDAKALRDIKSTKSWTTQAVGGPYVEVDGKADLSKFNEAFFEYNDNVLNHICSVGGQSEDDMIDGWRQKGGCPYSPWNVSRNIQAEDHCGPRVGDPVQAAWVDKWVKHAGRFGCVTWQLSNESGLVGSKAEVLAWERWMAETIRASEDKYGYQRHPILTNSGIIDIVTAAWIDGSNWHGIQYAPVGGKVTACNEINPAPSNYRQEYCSALAGKAYLWLWRAELPAAKWESDLADVKTARQTGCGTPMPTCTLGTPTARQLVALGKKATVAPQRTVAGSYSPQRSGIQAGKWISATPKGQFGKAYYCAIGWAEACAEPDSFIGPVAPEGHPERQACEAQFLEAPCPLMLEAKCTGTGNQCPITWDPYIVIGGVNQFHPENVRAGCREGLFRRDAQGNLIGGEWWKATGHGKGFVKACNFDASVCGVAQFEIDQ